MAEEGTETVQEVTLCKYQEVRGKTTWTTEDSRCEESSVDDPVRALTVEPRLWVLETWV